MSLLRNFKIFGNTSGNVAEVTADNAIKIDGNAAGASTADNQVQPFGFDAGGRTRVSQITTLHDGKILGSDDTLMFQNNGTGTATYSNNKVNLSVTSGQYIIRQTKRFFPYFAGKSQLIECTFDNFQTQLNVTKRVGYFSSNAAAPFAANFDGVFIEDNGVNKSLKIWRNGTQTVNVAFTAMDNASAIVSQNWSNFNVIAFDFLWLGGAILRFFVKTEKGFELIHTVNYSNTATDTFMLSPNQPLRYEVRSSTGTGSLRYICSQVATEGSVNESGKPLSIYNILGINTNIIGTIYAIKSIRKLAAFRDTAVYIANISATVAATNDSGIIMLIVNPTLSAPITYTTNGKISEGTPTTQTITAGTGRVLAAYAVNTPTGSDSKGDSYFNYLSGLINNTMDEYVLAYMPASTNQRVHGIISIKEL